MVIREPRRRRRVHVLAACALALTFGEGRIGGAAGVATLSPLVIDVETEPGRPAGPASARSVVGLEAALALVADLRRRWPARPVVLALAPGIHRLAHALRIGPEHSGPATARLTIRGAPGQKTRILGSVALKPAPIRLGADLVARLPAAARAQVRAYQLPDTALARPTIQGAKLLRSRPDALGLAVFDAGGALTPARWPDDGWAKVSDGSTDAARPGLTIDTDHIARWRGEPDLWAEGYWRWNWLFESLPVAAVDPAARRILLPELPYEGILAGARFRVIHALSELDTPGEWWRDRADGLLLAWPRAKDGTLDVAVTDTLLSLDGASHVLVENLGLEQSRGDMVTVRGGEDVVFRDARFAWAGGRGAVFADTRDGGLEGCDLHDIGRVAVRLEGGDRPSLTPGGLVMRGSRLTRWALRSRTQSPAVEIEGVGALVSGNLIHDGIDGAIHIHGNEHRIVGNEIARVVVGSSDNGAVYAGRDWTARGTRIEGNLLHDIRAEPGTEVKGVYLDDEASGFTVRRNLFLRVDQPVFIGGGRDNLVAGNVFVASSPGVHIDSRGQTWAAAAIRDPGSELRLAYAAMPVESRLWRERYPGLAEILRDRPEVARSNRVERNVFVMGRGLHIDDGGEAAEQIIRDNVGPGGIGLAPPGELKDRAAQSEEPADFAGLLGPDGRPAADFDLTGMRRPALRDKSEGR